MNVFDKVMFVKIKSLPAETREKVINGLIKMLAERPKGADKEIQYADNPGAGGN